MRAVTEWVIEKAMTLHVGDALKRFEPTTCNLKGASEFCLEFFLPMNRIWRLHAHVSFLCFPQILYVLEEIEMR